VGREILNYQNKRPKKDLVHRSWPNWQPQEYEYLSSMNYDYQKINREGKLKKASSTFKRSQLPSLQLQTCILIASFSVSSVYTYLKPKLK
jgi:hypothetical protein